MVPQQLGERLNRRVDPLADAATATLNDSRRAIERVTGVLDKAGGAADKVSGAADRVGRAAERAGTMLAPEAPLVRDVQRAAAELAATAAALRQHTADEEQNHEGPEEGQPLLLLRGALWLRHAQR